MSENSDAYKLTAGEQSALDVYVKVEEQCAGLYRNFAGLFEHDQEVASLWVQTAEEEDSHAEQFRMAARLKGVGVAKVQEETDTGLLILDRIAAFLLQAGKRPPTLQQALHFAISLEEELSEFHMDSVLQFDDPDLEKVFLALLRCDKGHVARLEMALQRLQRRH